MEISFETRPLRTLCHNGVEAEKAYGEAVAAALRRVLADLRAANTMFDMATIFDLPSGMDSELSTPLALTHRLLLRCGNRKPPVLPSGEIDWHAVDRVKIIDVTTNG